MEKTKGVDAPKKRPKCIIFEPTDKARKKLEAVIKKGYTQREVLNDLLEVINPSHYAKRT